MNETSRHSTPPTSPDTPSAISSPDLAAGVTPCDSPVGPMTDLFGQVVAPVSPLVVRENLGGGAIHAIFGQRGIASSASAALQSSLVNRLKQRLDTAGLTLFAMTWSEKTTPSGRSVCLLRASGHRTSGSGCGSWQTPKAVEMARSEAFVAGREALSPLECLDLASWPSPTVGDSASARNSTATRHKIPPTGIHAGNTLTDAATLSSWGTPTVQDSKHATASPSDMTRNPGNLRIQATLSSCATPTSRDHKDGSSIGTAPENALLGRQVWQTHGPISSGSPAATAKPGQLNPAFSRWLMGYPPAWDACAGTAMPSSRRSQPK